MPRLHTTIPGITVYVKQSVIIVLRLHISDIDSQVICTETLKI